MSHDQKLLGQATVCLCDLIIVL